MERRRVGDIEYWLLPGTARRTTDIVIERDGRVTVRPPLRLTPEQVDQTVHGKRLWIHRNLVEWRTLNGRTVSREWGAGESFLYLGRHYRLRLVSAQAEPLLLKGGRFCLRRDVLEQGGAGAAEAAFVAFYQARGLPRLRARVAHFAPRVGVAPGTVTVRDLGFRWGACQPSGDLSFHWKCLLAPLTVIDYIVTHELCHLRHRDHTAAFWNEVDKVLPDHATRKAWLRRHGAELGV